MRPLAILAAAVLAAMLGACVVFVVGSRTHTYHGQTADAAAWNPNTDRTRVVEEARKLIGIWYDPAQGYLNDIGGKLGMIVCMDVPVLAYRNAGTSIRKLLESDYSAHPGHYGKRDGRPGDPYFHRRARNLYSYCRFNGCLDQAGPPQAGDVVFMSRSQKGWITHIAIVTEVSQDGRYRVVEASRDEWYVTREEPGEKMFQRGWLFRGFGRPLASGKK